ncbi:CAP-associated domain-containing protein [Carnobacterium alterfunditum]|uniref:CAP-associated domain-containing protein n=1 Tax=Carnobacterium alterfunditum TaxID=28230 RepID=UPI003593F5F8
MKTFLRAMPLVFIMLLIVYWLPEVISKNPTDIITPKEESESIQSESFDYQTTDLEPEQLPVLGLGSYIGKNVESFTENFGDPKRIDPTIYGEEQWIFGEHETDYVQLGVKNGVITDLFALGSDLNVAPFEIGMSITEVFQIASFYPTYSVESQDKQVTLELTESDLNYRPLIAFDNQTFAVLMMDRSTNQITAVRYLDASSLLRLGVYDDGSVVNDDYSIDIDETNQKVISEANKKQVYEILNILRQRYELSVLNASDALSEAAQTIFIDQEMQLTLDGDGQLEEEGSFAETSGLSSTETYILDDKSRYVEDNTNQEFQPLTSEQIEHTLQKTNLELDEVRILYSNQKTDMTWLVTNWLTLEIERKFLMDARMTEIGVAYRGNDILLILH